MAILDQIDACAPDVADFRAASIARAYYTPSRTDPDPRSADRVQRVTNRQVVVVSATDGTIITTWRDPGDTRGTTAPFDRLPVIPPRPGDPRDYAALLDLLRCQGVALTQHRWGDYWQVPTPAGIPAFLPVDPIDGEDDVAADTAVLRLLGALASKQS